MINAGIKEVKNNLSRILAKVKAGEEILITKKVKARCPNREGKPRV